MKKTKETHLSSSSRMEGSKGGPQDIQKSRGTFPSSTLSEKPNKEIEPPLIEENAPLVEEEGSIATPRGGGGLESPSKSITSYSQGGTTTTPKVVTESFPFSTRANDQSN